MHGGQGGENREVNKKRKELIRTEGAELINEGQSYSNHRADIQPIIIVKLIYIPRPFTVRSNILPV